jgi:hypothetical protein
VSDRPASPKHRYIAQFGPGNIANLDSMRYRARLHSPTSRTDRFANFTTIKSSTKPKFDQTWKRLSELERYLPMDGSEVSYVPFDSDHVVHRSVYSGAISLVEHDSDSGTWTILVPRHDVAYSIVAGDGGKDNCHDE